MLPIIKQLTKGIMKVPSFSIRVDKDSAVEPLYFNLAELTYTKTKFDNRPTTFTEVSNLRALADFLDDVREELGHPIIVNSAYRSAEVNAAVKGVPNSLHRKGRAADITSIGHFEDLVELLRKRRTMMSEFIVYRDRNFVHIAI